MKIEEAIEWMEETIQDINELFDQCSTALQEEITEQKEVFELALTALRSVSREQELEAENKELKERIVNWRKYMAPTREQVEKVWRGEWIHAMPMLGSGDEEIHCSECGNIVGFKTDFCPHCGAPMTDEAVQMVMERLEALK